MLLTVNTDKSLFQGTIESFHHADFDVSAGGEMMNLFLFHQSLEAFVVKFFNAVRLKILRLKSLASFQNLLLSSHHVFSGLRLDGFHPGMFGEHVDHGQ